MTRRQFVQATATGIAGVALTPHARHAWAEAPPKRRPNLLFVFSDQQSWDMLGCYGNDSIQTPNLDGFAEAAVRFNHCVSNAPVCTPYRGLLLSGRHPLHNGAVFNDWQMLPGAGTHFAEVLRDAGYRTGYVGKWHLMGGDRDRPVPEGPLRYGFDDYFLTNNCTLEFRAGKSWYWDHDNQRAFYDKWEPDAQTDHAIDFLDQREKADEQPWALFVSWHPPHNWHNPDSPNPPRWRYEGPEASMQRYDPDKVHLRPTSPQTHEQRRIYHGYQALCSNLDDNFGRLLAALERRGELDRTVIVYTSDHGDCLRSNGRFDQHKRRPEADSARVPLLLRAPGLEARTSDLLIGGMDLMPTLLAMLGLKPPDTCHGADLSGAIAARNDDAVESIPMFLSSPDRTDWRGVYTHRYTYSIGPDGERFVRLYDRNHDPWEQRNLFGEPEHRSLQQDLHDKTVAWMQRFGDRLVPHEKIFQRTLKDPPADGRLWRDGRSGALKGRPIDRIADIKGLIEP